MTTAPEGPRIAGSASPSRACRVPEARRGALPPGDVGLVAVGHHRTAGLRREEVAHLAGVSVSWYTWIEQGRPINASADVLDALARTHLFQLASTRRAASVTRRCFIQHQLVPADEPDLRIVVQIPAPGDDSAVRLAK